jgi:hypothetical protein
MYYVVRYYDIVCFVDLIPYSARVLYRKIIEELTEESY